MASARRVEPEWLDELPADDTRALRSRRDLARINALMSNPRIVRRELARGAPGARALAEIGAGDGGFALRVVMRLDAAPATASLTLVDRQTDAAPATLARLRAAGWSAASVRADVFEWLRRPATPVFDAMFANLFLHHFEGEELATLLALVAARTRFFVACEPRRSALALAASRLLPLAACSAVTRHDATVSVRAGFRGAEIGALWPRAGWIVEEHERGLFSHCFAARRA